MSDAPLTNDEKPSRMMISFPLITSGHDTELDVINICVQCFKQLDGDATSRVLEYLAQRYKRPF